MTFLLRHRRNAAAGAVAGALALGGLAYTTFEPDTTASRTVAQGVMAVPPAAATTAKPVASPAAATPTKAPGTTSSTTPAAITITAKSSATSAGTDTVFTVSGKVTGAKPGAKIRLQRQSPSTDPKVAPTWATLAYTTFTGSDNTFSFPVKIEQVGAYKLRVLHPSDIDGPAQAYSGEFAVTVK